MTYQNISLTNLIRRLLQPPLRRINPPITLINVLLQVAHVIILEAILLPLLVRQRLVLRLQPLRVHLGAGANVLLGVGEQIVRTGAGEVRTADFGIRHGELGGARRRRRAHELLEQLSLFGGHGCGCVRLGGEGGWSGWRRFVTDVLIVSGISARLALVRSLEVGGAHRESRHVEEVPISTPRACQVLPVHTAKTVMSTSRVSEYGLSDRPWVRCDSI